MPAKVSTNPLAHFIPPPPLQEDFGLENWMSLLAPEFKSCPLFQLAIPGSHDSMMNKVMDKSPTTPEAPEFIKYLKATFPFIVKDWVITQNYDATMQLRNGIRYFDIRACQFNGKFMLCHGLCTGETDQPLKDINAFLSTHPDEVVILDFQHVYQSDEDDHRRYIQELKNIYGSKIYSRAENPDLKKCTLETMRKMEKQVIIIYRNYEEEDGVCWTSDDFLTPWPQTTNLKQLKTFLEQGVENRPCDRGFVTQMVLTPDFWFILRNLMSGRDTIKLACATPVLNSLCQWITTRKSGPDCWPGHNIFIADFIDLYDLKFVRAVLSLNKFIDSPQSPRLINEYLAKEQKSLITVKEDPIIDEPKSCCRRVFCC